MKKSLGKDLPFFARYLVGQHLRKVSSASGWDKVITLKHPSDGDDDPQIVWTQKYPSDNDEDPTEVTQKYPSDDDEGEGK